MLSIFASCAIVAGSIAGALIFLLIFRRFWLARVHKQHNDIIGWQISFLSTTYAVIIAFMLSDVWNNYQAAETNAEVEANSVLNVYHVAEGFPRQQRDAIRSLARHYADVMVREEWPAMQQGGFSTEGYQTTSALWQALMATRTANGAEQGSFDRALNDLTSLTEHRRIRQLQSRAKLPAIFWAVLIIGGLMTVIYTCLFDVEDPRLHVLQVVSVSFFISLVLVTIADVDGPYGGAVRIPPTSFEMVRQLMQNGSPE
jgi:MFS family permease